MILLLTIPHKQESRFDADRPYKKRNEVNMKIDVGKIALVAVMIAGIQTGVLYHRIDDLECQRDIYKSRYEDWEGVSKEIAGYADTLRDSLKARDRLDGKLLVEDEKQEAKK